MAALAPDERDRAVVLVRGNVFDPELWHGESEPVRRFLDFYLLRREDVPLATEEEKRQAIALWEASVHNS